MSKAIIEFGHASPEDFFYWINERHQIFLNRAMGEPRPWTDDPILDQFKFTNAFRQLDHGTQWLINELVGAGDTDDSRLLFNIVTFRMYN